MADLQLLMDYSSVKKANKELEQTGTTAKKSAAVFEAAFKKAEAQTKKNLIAARQQLDLSKRLQAQKAKESKEAAAAAALVAKEEERLKNKFVEGYTAMNIYSKELNDLSVARKQGIITAQQQRAEVARLNEQYQNGTGIFAQYANAMGKSSNRMGVAMQQTGYQVGDFLVQVQSGTNPMVAFGQQATQLVGVLYLLPQATLAARVGLGALSVSLAGLTLGLSIIIPLLTAVGAAWMRTSEGAKEADDAVSELDDTFESLRKTLKDYRIEQEAVAAGFADVREFALTAAIEESKESLATLRSQLEELDSQVKTVTTPEGDFVRATGPVKEQLEAREAIAALQEVIIDQEQQLAALQDMNSGKAESAAQEKLNSLRDELALRQVELRYGTDSAYLAKLRAQQEAASKGLVDENAEAYVRLTLQIQAAEKVIEETVKPAEELKKRVGEAAFEALKLAGVDITSGISKAEEAAAKLAAKMGITLEAAMALARMGATEDNQFMQMYESGQFSGAGGSGYRSPEYANLLDRLKNEKDKPVGGSTQADPLKDLQDRIALEQELLGKTEAQQRVIQALGVNWQDYSATALSGIFETIEEMDRLNQKAAEQEQISKTIESSMNTAFMSMVDGTKSVSDAFKDMARAIIADLYQIYVVKKITGMITGAIGGAMAGPVQGPMLPSANGNVFQGGSQVKAFADGGVVGGPTTFPMAGGQTGLMGEAGPEAIMPLKRGANGKLGVQVEGNSGGAINIVQNFSFAANGDESVKKLIAQAAPQIANMTQKQILDSRRRGGAMKSTFG